MTIFPTTPKRVLAIASDIVRAFTDCFYCSRDLVNSRLGSFAFVALRFGLPFRAVEWRRTCAIGGWVQLATFGISSSFLSSGFSSSFGVSAISRFYSEKWISSGQRRSDGLNLSSYLNDLLCELIAFGVQLGQVTIKRV